MRCSWDCSKYRERPDAACVGDEQLCLAAICIDERHPDRGDMPRCTLATESREWWPLPRIGALVIRGAECTANAKPRLFDIY